MKLCRLLLLIPGYGAQGGTAEDVAAYLEMEMEAW